MKTKWTPGPWHPVWSSNGHFLIGIAAQDGLGITDPKFNLWQGDDPEAKANARLIAEAPALYTALERLARAYVGLLETGRDRIVSLGGQCDPVDVMEAGDPVLMIARTALSRARGDAR